jgi:hypothetical protein
LINPEQRPAPAAAPRLPLVTIHHPAAVKLYDALQPGRTAALFSWRLPAPVEKPVQLRNVVGLLRGSDPALKDTYVLLTAHYDHVGLRRARRRRLLLQPAPRARSSKAMATIDQPDGSSNGSEARVFEAAGETPSPFRGRYVKKRNQ